MENRLITSSMAENFLSTYGLTIQSVRNRLDDILKDNKRPVCIKLPKPLTIFGVRIEFHDKMSVEYHTDDGQVYNQKCEG